MPKSFVKGGGSGSSGITVGTTTSNGTADTLLKTNATGKVADATGVAQASGKTLVLTAQDAADEPLTIQQAASQSGNALEILRNGSATPALSFLDTAGASSRLVINSADNNAGLEFKESNSSKFVITSVGGALNFYNAALASNTTRLSTVGVLAHSYTATVASAAAIAPNYNVFHVTGTTNITSITATNILAGSIVVLIFDDVLTFTAGNNLKIAGNFTTSALDTITLVYDGTNFHEMARSVNA